jgi:hypothetical protein
VTEEGQIAKSASVVPLNTFFSRDAGFQRINAGYPEVEYPQQKKLFMPLSVHRASSVWGQLT